jgi:hypothetical protein
VRPGEVADAASSIGHAGPDSYSPDQLKQQIIARAEALVTGQAYPVPCPFREMD